MKILKLSLKEIKKKKLFSLLLFIVCFIAMHTILSAITNATSTIYQKKIFESSIGVDMENVLHLDYKQTEENAEFAKTIQQYLNYIKNITNVEAVGQFDITGMYFSELKTNEKYKIINQKLLQGNKYENYPAITQLLSIDEEILSFVKGNITEYAQTQSGLLPLYVSKVFNSVLPIGMVLTDERTGDKYEIVGYFPKGTKWIDENDLIRFPLISLDGYFIAPFTEQSKNDIMTQLSMLHNTYILLSDNANINYIKKQITIYSLQHDFEASSALLSEEYETYRLETESYTNNQIILAIFISIMAVSSIVAVFTTNTLLKKKQYGILIANGFAIIDIAISITTEIFIIMCFSGGLAWIMKYIEFKRGTDLFQDMLLTAHIRYTFPLYILSVFILTGISALLPTIKVLKYQPCELIGGNTND